ncbi:MAG: hypothetical protein ACREPL_10640, partial [Rhodanobacteraceae bacterium]
MNVGAGAAVHEPFAAPAKVEPPRHPESRHFPSGCNVAFKRRRCRHLIRAEVQQFLSSFRGCPRRLGQNPESSFCSIGPENWIPGSVVDEAGDGPGMMVMDSSPL